ncbi:MAG: 2-oxoacid:ferredoxin/flavodoxin oxidoreductase gamma subunit family protein [Bacteriovoracaceae bacterium]|nr:2-oxoacid:ferredoxin/flavodoxin oxidoreductase gamma subunit family protein [Bacteriovoracaceae bacterium]
MGIPVSGKNLFPSNIQGLPTWFTIRVNKDGWAARKAETEILVCMNDQTYVEDVKALKPGSVVLHHEHMSVPALRKDVTSISIPFSKIISEACPDPRLRKLAVNMVYVGVLAEFLGITDEGLELAMAQQFKTKQKVIDLNRAAIVAGRKFAKEHSEVASFPFKVEPMNKTQGKILIEGNAACALGSVFSGCTVVSWYPITPSSSVIDYFTEYAEKYRVDPVSKQKNFAIVQAEDELSAMGMVLGASWMGARAMTSTSGPGISLIAEFTGLGYFAEIPAVVYDIQRVGPSTGLPTRTSQADVLFAAILSHGDTKNICLYPGSVLECYEFAAKAFDTAERFQTPVFVLSDLDIGMNFYMADPFPYLEAPLDRGKVLTDKDTEKLATYGRYADVDGDGIPYRTLPGMKDRRGVFFTRGSGHNEKAAYTESGVEYKNVMDRLLKKWETAKSFVPAPILTGSGKNRIGVIAYGSSNEPMMESIHQLKTEAALEVDYLRIRAYPFSNDVKKFLENHDVIYVVEQNRDAQLLSLIKMEKGYESLLSKTESILHYSGLPLDARYITNHVLELESNKQKKRIA